MVTPEKDKQGNPIGEVTPGGGIRRWFADFMDLREGSDREGAVHSIVSGKLMRGSNAWMLVCSIMIASLGLNLNSGAVIIGAMLISPLMNPILGIGLGVGTNDREMLWIALKNFGVAVIIALVTSFVYFFLTPLIEFTPEMEARTEPTILDGLVAVFGGLAGIISVTRADKTNAIPGVAIATALMPPLCVAGYGLVVGVRGEADFNIFWRAFYLFFLNSFFIAATAYLIIRILRFPFRTYMNSRETIRSQVIIGVISVMIIVPGYFILRDVLQRQRYAQAAERFTLRYFPESRRSYYLSNENPGHPTLNLTYIERATAQDSLSVYAGLLRDSFGIAGAEITIRTAVDLAEIDGIKGELASLEGINIRLAQIEGSLARQAEERAQLADSLRTFRLDTTAFLRFARQLQLAFPGVRAVRLARSQSTRPFGPDDEPRYEENLPLLVIEESGSRLDRAALIRLDTFVRFELGLDTLVLLRE